MKTLENWLNNGWLIKHQTSREEVVELFQVADRDLRKKVEKWFLANFPDLVNINENNGDW